MKCYICCRPFNKRRVPYELVIEVEIDNKCYGMGVDVCKRCGEWGRKFPGPAEALIRARTYSLRKKRD